MDSEQHYRDEIERLKFEKDAKKDGWNRWHKFIQPVLTITGIFLIFNLGRMEQGGPFLLEIVAPTIVILVLLGKIWILDIYYSRTFDCLNSKIRKRYATLLDHTQIHAKNKNR